MRISKKDVCEVLNKLQSQVFRIDKEVLNLLKKNRIDLEAAGILMDGRQADVPIQEALDVWRASYESFVINLATAYQNHPFYLPAFMDFRGRIYRAAFKYKKFESLFESYKWYMVNLPNWCLPNSDNLDLKKFIHFAKHASDPFQFMAKVMSNEIKHTSERIEGFYRVPVTQDASASAYQFMSYFLLNPELGSTPEVKSVSYPTHIPALKASNKERRAFIVADTETILINDVHVPYAAGFLVVNPGDDVSIKPDYELESYFSEDTLFFIPEFEDRSNQMLFYFLERLAMVALKEKIGNVYFHNFSRFDGIIYLQYYALHRDDYYIKPLMRNHKLYKLEVYRNKKRVFSLRDSLTLVPSSLATLAKALWLMTNCGPFDSFVSSLYEKRLEGNVIDTDWNPPKQSAVQMSAAIIAYSRIHMYKYISGSDYYYTDTDSTILGSPLPEDEISSILLGKLKLENIISKGIFLAPKSYYLETPKDDLIIKHKGAAKNMVNEEWFEKQYADPSRTELINVESNFRIEWNNLQIIKKDFLEKINALTNDSLKSELEKEMKEKAKPEERKSKKKAKPEEETVKRSDKQEKTTSQKEITESKTEKPKIKKNHKKGLEKTEETNPMTKETTKLQIPVIPPQETNPMTTKLQIPVIPPQETTGQPMQGLEQANPITEDRTTIPNPGLEKPVRPPITEDRTDIPKQRRANPGLEKQETNPMTEDRT
ncbi:hypothetical protein IFM89_037148 [Coptis chinensis]|uniref:DNA-directed DNA polymerase n=1 Tax=Coptis chinensis TaxID=261450 RepID=A0A835HML9_9MAGN|nr:hypothetical protein IFM89_037148 [Coptis chinensis]